MKERSVNNNNNSITNNKINNNNNNSNNNNNMTNIIIYRPYIHIEKYKEEIFTEFMTQTLQCTNKFKERSPA